MYHLAIEKYDGKMHNAGASLPQLCYLHLVFSDLEYLRYILQMIVHFANPLDTILRKNYFAQISIAVR
jgi:hypothetical protein